MSDDKIQNTYLTGKAFVGDRSRAEIKKTLEQKIAGAQNKLNYLKAKEKKRQQNRKYTTKNNSGCRGCQGFKL